MKKGFKADNQNATQIDWVMAKRPIKQISNRMNASPIKFLIFTARAKDLYEGSGDNPQKVGITPDIMKGMDYDVNLALRFGVDNQGKWMAEVTKVQGALGRTYPLGKQVHEFPIKDILDYSARLKAKAMNIKSEDEIASELIADQNKKAKTQGDLLAFGKQHGLTSEEVGAVLKAKGLGFEPDKWAAMEAAIMAYRKPAAVPVAG